MDTVVNTIDMNDTKALARYFEAEIERLQLSLDQHAEENGSNGHSAADLLDEGIAMQARFDNHALYEHQQWLLAQYRAAQRRLQEGSYGICIDCGGAIPVERLEAIPHAIRCVSCQGKHDRARRY